MGDFWKWFTGEKKAPVTSPKQVAPVAHNPRESTGKRKLGYWVLLFIFINSVLGSSLFYLPSLGVKSSGAASIIAWAVLFFFAVLIMLYMGELVSLHPSSGGTYEFTKRAFGRFGAFFSGWLIWLAGNLGMSLNLIAAAEYFIPETGSAAFMLRMVFVGVWILILNFMAYRGVDAGSTMLVVFGVIAIIVMLGLIIPSFIDVTSIFAGQFVIPFDSQLLVPFFQYEGLPIIAFLSLSLLLISEAFLGFEVISYLANEAKEPRKLHKVLISGMMITGLLIVVYILASLGTVSYGDYIQDARPFAVQAFNIMGEAGQKFIVFGMYLVIIGVAAAWPITGSRLINAMSRDKLFISHLGKLNPKTQSPTRAVIFQTIIVAAFSFLLFRGYQVGWQDPYRTMYLMYVLLSLFVVALLLLTVPILRRKEKDLERPYKAPFGTIGPVFFILILIGLVVNWVILEQNVAWAILSITGSVAFLGLPLYFMVEMFYDPKAITRVNEKLSFFAVLTEKLFFPISIKNTLLKDMGDLKGKVILEYGCSVGTLTKKLAPRVTEKGRIFATDLSLKKVQLATKQTDRHPHVSVHHHPHLDDFKLKLPHQVDGVLSIGMLSYMQQPHKILSSLSKHVKKGGEIVFLDYDKFFYFIPNVEWIQDDAKLQAMFKNAGFSVKVERRRGLLWTYVIIYGTRN